MNRYINIKEGPSSLVVTGETQRRHFLFHAENISAATSELTRAKHETKAKRALYKMRHQSVKLVAGVHTHPGKVLCYDATFDKHGLQVGADHMVDWDNVPLDVDQALSVLFQHLASINKEWRTWVNEQYAEAQQEPA